MNSDLLDPFDQISRLKTIEGVTDAIRALEAELAKGRGKAGFLLGLMFDPDNAVLDDEIKRVIHSSYSLAAAYYEKGFELLLQEAKSGNAESMYLVAWYFQGGNPPVSLDLAQYEFWKDKAIAAGYRGGGQI